MRTALRIAGVAVASALVLTLAPTASAEDGLSSKPPSSSGETSAPSAYRADRAAADAVFASILANAKALSAQRGQSVPFTEKDMRVAAKSAGAKYFAGNLTFRGKHDIFITYVDFARGKVGNAGSHMVVTNADPAAWSIVRSTHAGAGTLAQNAKRVEAELQDVTTEFGKIRISSPRKNMLRVTFTDKNAPVFTYGVYLGDKKPKMYYVSFGVKADLK